MISPSVLKKAAALALVALASLTPALAESVATVPVGYISINLPDGSVTPKQVAVYFGLTDTPAGTGKFAGIVTGVTTNTVTVAGAGWTAGALSAPAAPYFLRFTSGSAEGTTWQISTSVANTAETVTVVLPSGINLTSAGAAVNNKFEIFPADTLATLFGTELKGGTSAADADNVSVWGGASWTTFYFNTASSAWFRAGTTNNANNFVVRPDQGLLITRRGPAKTLTLVGRAPSSAISVRVGATKDSFVGLFPTTKTLASLNLQTLPGWSSNATESLADKVSFWGGATWVSFYHNGTEWKRVGTGQAANATVIQQPDRPLLVTKAGTPVANFVKQDKPY